MKQGTAQPPRTSCDLPFYDHLTDNVRMMQGVMAKCSDIVYRRFRLFDGRDACLIYLRGADSRPIDADILPPLTIQPPNRTDIPLTLTEIIDLYVHVGDVKRRTTFADAVTDLTGFRAILLIDCEVEAITLDSLQYPQRSVAEPSTEAVIRGPHEGFIEDLGTNLVMIRRKLHTPHLKSESLTLGTYSQTQIVVCYIDGIVDPALVQEVNTRLQRINIDAVLESGYIEEFIEDAPYSPFPQLQNTERPDVVAALLMEGRVAILTNGTPFALIGPVNLWGALASPEDYYERYFITNLLRLVRFLFVWVALLLPSLYIAITTFHQEVLPTNLLLSIAAARENTPFPAFIEALAMEITFEALREAGVRLPQQVGQAVSIVGALVIGQAAVQAGIVSAPMVIVVSITGISSFTIPRFNFAISIRLLRFPMMVLAATLGIFGVFIGVIAIFVHLSALRSLGSPYLMPIAPFSASGMKDTVIRVPWWAMRTRPFQTSKANIQRGTTATTPKSRLPRMGRKHTGDGGSR